MPFAAGRFNARDLGVFGVMGPRMPPSPAAISTVRRRFGHVRGLKAAADAPGTVEVWIAVRDEREPSCERSCPVAAIVAYVAAVERGLVQRNDFVGVRRRSLPLHVAAGELKPTICARWLPARTRVAKNPSASRFKIARGQRFSAVQICCSSIEGCSWMSLRACFSMKPAMISSLPCSGRGWCRRPACDGLRSTYSLPSRVDSVNDSGGRFLCAGDAQPQG